MENLKEFSRKINIEDFDRNDTYLDPHPGFFEYGEIGKVNGVDTLVLNWSEYLRQRSGSVNNIAAAASYKLNEYINLGLGFNYQWGNSDDYQSLTRVGVFDLIRENRFRFSYVDAVTQQVGTSDFKWTDLYAGVQLNLDHFSLGVKVNLPYTITRDWQISTTSADSISSNTISTSGSDKLKIPAKYTFGAAFAPLDNFLISVDYEYQPLSDAEYELNVPDNTIRSMPDRKVIKA